MWTSNCWRNDDEVMQRLERQIQKEGTNFQRKWANNIMMMMMMTTKQSIAQKLHTNLNFVRKFT